jgi:hypothetical protein
MRTFDGVELNDKYAGGQQDIFVLSLLGTEYNGTFVDIGCREPINHSNSALLEKYGWMGIAVDINNYANLWKTERPNSIFIQSDALKLDYRDIFNQTEIGNPISYLSIDLDGRGIAFQCLKNVIETGYEFKVLTIEHDAYSGNVDSDMIPQRELLKSKGYVLVRQCDIIEDFWINPKYINLDTYEKFIYTNSKDLSKELHFWNHCKNIDYNFTKLYL